MFDRLEVFEKKYEECNQKLYDPAVVSDPEAYAALMKEVKGLEPVVEKYKEYKKQKNNEEEAKQLLAEGGLEKDFREMVELELEDERRNPKYGILAVKEYLQKSRFPAETTIELAGTPVGIYE